MECSGRYIVCPDRRATQAALRPDKGTLLLSLLNARFALQLARLVSVQHSLHCGWVSLLWKVSPSVAVHSTFRERKDIWMNRAFTATLLGGILIITLGCKSKIDDKEAIRAGVIKYLTSLNMLNINAMDIKVTQATVNGNQAQAQVEIRAKSADTAGSSMQLNYSLEKRGYDWVVLKSQPAGGSMQHPAPGSMSPNGMPPGHPTVGGTGIQPSGHSDFNDIMKSTQPPAQQPPSPSSPAAKP
jgi:hypothetical protein